jgi:hypothetical protein
VVRAARIQPRWAGPARSTKSTKQLGQADLKDVRDLARCVDGDVDSAAFEQAHVGPMELARFGKALLRESLRSPDLPDPRSQALLKL